jgi:hypothetical protein
MIDGDARRAGRAFVVFCDGAEQGGLVDYARRGRAVARLLLDAIDELEAERSVRVALQERCETQQAILGRAAYDELVRRSAA